MRKERLYHSIRLLLLRNNRNRTKYIKEHNILGYMGENCTWGPWLVPLYPKLIKIHNNVTIHKNAKLIPHDVINGFLIRCNPNLKLATNERIGCIEIMDNVYVSTDAIILPDVRINKNCIITAGSVVANDIPENSIVAGNPAKVIGKFDTFVAFRKMRKYAIFKNQELPDDIALEQWSLFEKKRNKSLKK